MINSNKSNSVNDGWNDTLRLLRSESAEFNNIIIFIEKNEPGQTTTFAFYKVV